MSKLKERFMQTYSNLPLGIRSEIIAVIDSEPMTWHVCYLEISQETKMGDTILNYLDKLRFI